MERWSGRVALVTGASSGIGEAIAKALAEHGMKVVAVARRLDKLQVLAEEMNGKKGEVHAVQGDVTKEEDVKRVVKWARDNLGGADVLVNNAGVGGFTPLTGFPTERMRQILDVNVIGLSMCTREVFKDMRDRDINDGHIFHIGSLMGQSILEVAGMYPYSGSKHMVKVLTEGLRRELRDHGTKIRVTSISPGLVRTEIMEAAGAPAQQVDFIYSNNPCLEPKDVADALLYALGAPPHVQVHELVLHPVGEKH